MKTALVCIAKNEDHYIDEWIKYHTKLGFDFIYVYQNNWRYKGDKSQYNNVHWIEFDGQAMQVQAYDNFVIYHKQEYDWVAFFDVDEFLVIKDLQFSNIKSVLMNFSDISVLGIPWRVFGSNNAKHPSIDNNYLLIDRFTKSSDKLATFKKLILNMSKDINYRFADPHYLKNNIEIIDTTRTYKTTTSLFPQEIENTTNQILELNHYMLLNFDERWQRKSCGDCFYGDQYRNDKKIDDERIWWNNMDKISNIINNMTAYNFKYS